MPVEEKADLNNEDLDEELVNILRDLASKYEKEDPSVRKQQVKIWRRNEEFWHGIQFIFWSEMSQDWISADDTNWYDQEEGREDVEGPYYEFVTNIYKAHGESIISALSAQVPAVRFPPDDAESDEDITTSKTYDRIADLIQRQNKAKILLLRALFYLWNQGCVFAYHYNKSDKAFGVSQIPEMDESYVCPSCGYQAKSEKQSNLEEDETGNVLCPECQNPMTPQDVITGFKDTPKGRITIELWGGLHCQVANYAQDQKDWPSMIFTRDLPIDFLKHLYPHIADKLDDKPEGFDPTSRAPSAYSTYSVEDINSNLRPLRRIWMRPWVLAGVPKEREKERKKLEKLFPSGIYVCFVGKTYVESRNEDLDKYWTGGKAGLSAYWHSDPLGQSLIPIQEMVNILTNLTIETIEQGIPSGFADPDVLNFDVYSRHEARPGMLYPARPKNPGQALGTSFYEGQRASLSKEVPFFGQKLTEMGQFVVGSFPSIYGGAGEGKSRTAAEYNMSRQMALQRLSIAWTHLNDWWARLMKRCVDLYVENMVEDEKFTVKQGKSDWVSVWIRRSELLGKIGDVEVEGAESFPVSTPQKQQLLFKLMEMQNPFIDTAIYDTSNRSTVADIISFPELNLPGEDQRIRQVKEINAMTKAQQPIPTHPEFDDDDIHIATLKHYLIGEEGADLEATNPQGFQAVLAHLQMHAQQKQQQEAQQLLQSVMAGGGAGKKPVGPPKQQGPQPE